MSKAAPAGIKAHQSLVGWLVGKCCSEQPILGSRRASFIDVRILRRFYLHLPLLELDQLSL